jgi:hypothetical protein
LSNLKLLEIEGAVQPATVAKELESLYHELSKDIHYPEVSDTGFICGGNLPLRAAVALAMLKLQQLVPENRKFVIKYADETYKVKKRLMSGAVIKPYDE